jgi:mannose-6-phosphate isomerase-like protein (cupin superfamily)
VIASKRKKSEDMATIIAKEQLQDGMLFQGKDYGGIPLSFFWMQLPPDEGPRLHFHPYDEVFLIPEGQATFTVGESTVEVTAGNVVIGPANVPHKFCQAGSKSLKIVTIHPSPRTIGTPVEK